MPKDHTHIETLYIVTALEGSRTPVVFENLLHSPWKANSKGHGPPALSNYPAHCLWRKLQKTWILKQWPHLLSTVGPHQRRCFYRGASWRDSFASTGTLRTLFSAGLIAITWKETPNHRSPSNFALTPRSTHVEQLGPYTARVDIAFTFEIEAQPGTSCSGSMGNMAVTDSP